MRPTHPPDRNVLSCRPLLNAALFGVCGRWECATKGRVVGANVFCEYFLDGMDVAGAQKMRCGGWVGAWLGLTRVCPCS